ncbi:lysylphosphatidylglycerol synthase transmembrane domain-containing protein [Thermodesulfatator atlanticus]|uniref:lysylphosphatidylglycerol synthase transmembrane domain-containing protein n=1 Tax=Thermodesulfatator atlanticus TaxID=501497 RepID=UPI0003B5CA82|nr:lysylphosphatidylglycerol synthase transmembrane domain-containing protein [Thermodesulfatator atlanticus]
MKKYLSFFFKLTVSAGLLYYLFRQTDFNALVTTFKKVLPEWLCFSILVFFVFQIVSAYRWQKITEALGYRKNFLFFGKIYFIGMFFNAFLPGVLGGDVIRVFYLVKEGASKTVASFSVFYDRIFGLMGALILLTVFVPLEGDFLPEKPRHILLWFSASALFFGTFAALFAGFFRKKWASYFLTTATSVTRLPTFFVLVGLGLAVQVLYNIHLYLLGRSLNIEVPLAKFFLIIPLMGILASLPLSLGGLGIREGTLAYFLKLLGYPTEVGIALGFLTYGVSLLGGLVGGFFYLRGEREKPS